MMDWVENRYLIYFIAGIIMGTLLGASVLLIYQENFKTKVYYQKEFDGLYFRNTSCRPGFETGNWICVNVQNMGFERAMDVCTHECGHAAYSEIFASKCENDAVKCDQLFEESFKK